MHLFHTPAQGFAHVSSPNLRAYLQGETDPVGDEIADLLARSQTELAKMPLSSLRLRLNDAAAEEYNDGREHRVAYWLQLAHDRDLDPEHPEIAGLDG